MHIKQVLISGFKSFRSQSEIDEFSPKHNVIVGRNGSGKSNFFDAIQFVLAAPKFATLRQEDRQNLLHEGAGSSVMAAYVEIVFDNSDGRMPVESEEVIIRRTVGHKKDEFFLNRKRIQKSEVVSLLESAGFSKSNPYYIVQQGKVANLCTMKDADRLQLLKEVAGTNVYEERRTESMKVLQETSLKQEKVQEVLGYIEERLAELEQEKAELTEYESLDKQRKAIEYNVFFKEQASAQEGLQQLDGLRENHSRELRSQYQQLQAVQEEVSAEDVSLLNQQALVQRLENRLSAKKGELNQYLLSRDNNDNEIAEFESKEFMKETEAQESCQLLEQIGVSIAQREAELAHLQELILQATAEAHGHEAQMAALQSKLEILSNKRTHNKPYNTQTERDCYIHESLHTINNSIASKEALLRDYEQHVRSLQQTLHEQQARTQRDEHQHAENSRLFGQLTTQINLLINQRNQLQEERKKTWQALERHGEDILTLKQDLANNKTLLNKTLPYTVAQGLTVIENIVAAHGIEGYYGPLIDNIIIKHPQFYNVLDKAGGLGLFNIIVDTDATASVLIKHLERQNVGRLTFLPLNRLRVPRTTYPADDSVKALVEVALEFEDYMAPAVHLVYGGKLLARDLHSAADSAARYGLDTYTMDGDHVSARGALEGGYHNVKMSKIQSIMSIRAVTDRITAATKEVEVLTGRNAQLESSVNGTLKDISKLEIEKDHLHENDGLLFREIGVGKKDAKELAANMANLQTQARKIESEVANLRQQVMIYEEELHSPFHNTITEAELTALQVFEQQAKELLAVLTQKNQQLAQLQQAKNGVMHELHHNLYKTKEEVEGRAEARAGSSGGAEGSGGRDLKAEISKRRLETELLQASIEGAQQEADEIAGQIAAATAQIAGGEQVLEGLRQQEQAVSGRISQLIKENDKVFNKKNMYLDTIASKTKLIKELGILSQPEVARFAQHSATQLMKELGAVNGKLGKYSNINRKALDQYLSFSNQKGVLFQRQRELDGDSASINTLIHSLDVQKDDNIVATFQNVNKHFVNVFSELVPQGKARLVLRTRMDGDLEDEEQSAAAQARNIDNIAGIGVEVSFSSTNGKHIYHNMAALSGGQKALVALAIIFAIQRCDPAPFYLFDEIDQALDSNHRLAVARLIQKQVNTDPSAYASVNANRSVKEQHYSPPQFITTTFRPELVKVADRWFGIALQNKISSIFPLQQAQAEEFVTELLVEEEAVGQVSAVPRYRPEERGGRGLRDEYEENDSGGEMDGDGEGDGDEEADEEHVEVDDDVARAMGFH